MSFDEFKKREWRVLLDPLPGTDAKHTPGDVVTFHGQDVKVIVRCKRYTDGRYDDEAGRIVGDGYTIDMTTGPNGKDRIVFTPTPGGQGSGSVGGSWTAEDTGSGADGGD